MFQTRMKELREKAGYKSQQAFAKAFGVAQSTVGGWEAGAREPNFATAIKLARFFGVSLDSLLVGEEKLLTPEDEQRRRIEMAKLALFGGDGEVTDEMWDEAMFAAELIKDRHHRKKDGNG